MVVAGMVIVVVVLLPEVRDNVRVWRPTRTAPGECFVGHSGTVVRPRPMVLRDTPAQALSLPAEAFFQVLGGSRSGRGRHRPGRNRRVLLAQWKCIRHPTFDRPVRGGGRVRGLLLQLGVRRRR